MQRISRAVSTIAVVLSTFFSATNSSAQTRPVDKTEIGAHFERARQALKEKKPDIAIREFQAVLALDPNNVDARANVGVVAFVQGKYADARQDFTRALALQPSLWRVQAMLGLCEKYLGTPESAWRILEKSFPHLEEPKLRNRVGLALVELNYQRGDLQRASTILHLLQKDDPSNMEVLYALYRTYSELSVQARDRIALLAPDSPRVHQILAQLLVNGGDIKGAMQQYREALQMAPELSGAHFELGEVMLLNPAAEHPEREARKEFETALILNPSDEKAEFRLGQISVLEGDMNTAFDHYLRATKLNPADAEAQIGFAKVLVALDQRENALEHLLSAIRIEPLSAVAHYRLSQLYKQMGRAAEANHELSTFQAIKEAQKRMRAPYSQLYPASRNAPVDADVPQ